MKASERAASVGRGMAWAAVVLLAACQLTCEGQGHGPPLAASGGASTTAPHAPVTAARIARGLEKAAAFLGPRELRGDQSWLVGRACHLLGEPHVAWSGTLRTHPDVIAGAEQDPAKMAIALEGALWKMRRRPTRSWPSAPLPNVAPASPVSHRFESQDAVQILTMTRAALGCTLAAALPQTFFDAVNAPASGYMLTHQLFALGLAYERGCLADELARSLRAALATRIVAEQRVDREPITDLSIERMALLCYVGLGHWVSEADLDALLAKQDRKGSWGSHGPDNAGGIDWAPHSAALGFFLLAHRWATTADHAAFVPRVPKSPAPR